MTALIGDLGYEYISERTGEARAWYSGLANAVLWKNNTFILDRSWRVQLVEEGAYVPGTSKKYTPRSAACAKLTHSSSGKSVVVCATHLLGGRFEDSLFVAEALADRNVRAEQVQKIAESVQECCGEGMPVVIAGDFNVMLHGYIEGSPFRQKALDYFNNQLINGALKLASTSGAGKKGLQNDMCTFDGFYVSFQNELHRVLSDKLGYNCAYARRDDDSTMKTSYYAGCTDWVYIRNLGTLRDEQIISAMDQGLSDHDPVMVTLQFE